MLQILLCLIAIANVLKQKELVLEGRRLSVTVDKVETERDHFPVTVDKAETANDLCADKVLVKGLSSDISDDSLCHALEARLKGVEEECDVTSIKRLSTTKAVVTFKNPEGILLKYKCY